MSDIVKVENKKSSNDSGRKRKRKNQEDKDAHDQKNDKPEKKSHNNTPRRRFTPKIKTPRTGRPGFGELSTAILLKYAKQFHKEFGENGGVFPWLDLAIFVLKKELPEDVAGKSIHKEWWARKQIERHLNVDTKNDFVRFRHPSEDCKGFRNEKKKCSGKFDHTSFKNLRAIIKRTEDKCVKTEDEKVVGPVKVEDAEKLRVKKKRRVIDQTSFHDPKSEQTKSELHLEIQLLKAHNNNLLQETAKYLENEEEYKSQLKEKTELLKKKNKDYENLQMQLKSAKSLSETLSKDLMGKNVQIENFQERAEKTNEDLNTAIKTTEKQSLLIGELKRQVDEQHKKLQQGEKTRRRLHNENQELRGNIRVICRVKPTNEEIAFQKAEEKGKVPPKNHTCTFLGGRLQQSILIQGPAEKTLAGDSKPGVKHSFHFDRVFKGCESQKDVFVEISQLVQSALDGYRVCIFAYGETGSGKTYTMEGPPGSNGNYDDTTSGMIPRAVKQIFEERDKLHAQGWTFEFRVCFLEIHNEEIRNLLSNAKERDEEKHVHEVQIVDDFSKVPVTNLRQVRVRNQSDIFRLLKRANRSRAVAATAMNDTSSRSHSLFMIFIGGSNRFTREETKGVLNLIDLAGSEDPRKSKAEGERLKETGSINKSLSSLKNVIRALKKHKKHVPYRDSKLTYLLKNYLGGGSKVLMFVNLSAERANFDESLKSLRFAKEANSCAVGRARRSVKG